MSGPTNIKTPSSSQQLVARAVLYQVLAFVFRPPSELGGHENWEEAAKILDEQADYRITGPLSVLLRDLAHLNPHDAQRHYEALFGHSAHGKCPPYELEYGEEHSFREPQQLADIAAFYNAFGLRPAGDVHERVDHAAIECEFAQFLLFKQAWALQDSNPEAAETCAGAMRHFLREHLGQWFPSFALRIARHAAASWQKAAADFALAFLLQDCQAMGVKVGRDDLPVRSPTPRESSGCTSCSLKDNTACVVPQDEGLRGAEYTV